MVWVGVQALFLYIYISILLYFFSSLWSGWGYRLCSCIYTLVYYYIFLVVYGLGGGTGSVLVYIHSILLYFFSSLVWVGVQALFLYIYISILLYFFSSLWSGWGYRLCSCIYTLVYYYIFLVAYGLGGGTGSVPVYYLPRRRRPGTGDIATPPVRLSVRPSRLVFAL